MNERDASHASELYRLIHQIDDRLEHLSGAHRLTAKIEVWASVATGNYPIEMVVPGDSPFFPTIKGAIEGQLMIERNLRSDGLRRLGFDVPERKP